jgi:long-chain fatty acid transport protein
MSARMGAGIASPCRDASAVYFSPAALAVQPSAIGVGVTLVRSGNSFTYDASDVRVERETTNTPVPYGFGSFRFGERFAAGIGVFAPYGLGLEWPLGFEGRYVGYDNALRGLYIQPTVAFQAIPNRLSVGAGVDFVRGRIEINQRSDLATVALPNQPLPGQRLTFANLGIPYGTDFADVKLAGDGSGVTFHLGAHLRATEAVSLGIRYLHEAKVDLDGTAEFRPVATGLRLAANNPLGAPAGTSVDNLVAGQFGTGGLLVNRGLASQITFPSQLVVGAALQATPALRLMADYQRTGWSSFDALQVNFQPVAGEPAQQDTLLDQTLNLGYRDANTFRLGAEFGVLDQFVLRGGFRYNTAATPTGTPLLPENERNYYSAGFGFAPGERFGLDLSYQYIQQADRRGRVRGAGPNVGLYTASGHTFGVTASYRFGRLTQQ